MDSSYPDVVLRPGGARRCRVLFSYSPQNDDELELQVNDEIQFLAEVEEGWWRGKLRNKVGVFPSNFVSDMAGGGDDSGGETSPITMDDAPILPPKPFKETCRVLFQYDAANDDELTLKKDEVVTIITKDVEDKGWWKGELRGRIGLFPDNFVEMLPQPEDMVALQQKKPDRPTKSVDSKIPLISAQSHKKSQDNLNQKDTEEKKSEVPFNKKNVQNKQDNKNLDLFQIKADTVASHRKSLELKATENLVGKKPLVPPPISNKPRPSQPSGVGQPGPVAGKVKRLSGELVDLVESSLNRSPSGPGLGLPKRYSGEVHDLIDGALNSKQASKRLSVGSDDLDLDSVERGNPPLTHITASRPKAPGRRPPSKDGKENDVGVLTNGTSDPVLPVTTDKGDKVDKKEKERQWEKHKPPWVDELKSNLKTTKVGPGKEEKTTPPHVQQAALRNTAPSALSPEPSPVPLPSTAATAAPVGSHSHTKATPAVTKSLHLDPVTSKISELSSRFDKAKTLDEVSSGHTEDDLMQVPKKDFLDLKGKVERLEKMVVELAGRLREESDKRRLMEKEVSKLTDLVTQV